TKARFRAMAMVLCTPLNLIRGSATALYNAAANPRARCRAMETPDDAPANQPGSELFDSLFWPIQVKADSTSASSLAVNPSILTPGASAFFLASSALATECTQTRPRRTLAVNFCCFSSVITHLLEIISSVTSHDTRQRRR